MSHRPVDEPTYPEYAEIRAEAERRKGPFVDPFDVHSRIPNLIGRRGHEWALSVLGREYWGPQSLYPVDLQLLKIADERDLNPPLPQWVVDARAAAKVREKERADRLAAFRQRDRDAWQALLPGVVVDLDVYTNTTQRVRNGFADYLAHAVPKQDAYSGVRTVRTHRAGRALCETETRPKPLSLHYSPEPAGTPVTCRRCLDWSVKVRNTREAT